MDVALNIATLLEELKKMRSVNLQLRSSLEAIRFIGVLNKRKKRLCPLGLKIPKSV